LRRSTLNNHASGTKGESPEDSDTTLSDVCRRLPAKKIDAFVHFWNLSPKFPVFYHDTHCAVEVKYRSQSASNAVS
jgi:hypothetical protein